jgi:hypothetical protein
VFQGIDEVAFYSDRALTSTRISAHYAEGTGSAGTTVTGGQAAESDTAQPGAVAATVPGSQASENDAGQAGTTAQSTTGGQAAETDTAQPGETTAGATVAGSRADETDTAQPGTVQQDGSVAGSQATETDTGQAGSATAGAIVAGGQADESDAAQAGTVVQPGDNPLAEFVSLYDSTELNGSGHLVETGADPSMLFILPSIVLDPATTYTVTVDFINAIGDSRISLYSSLGTTQVDADASQWFAFADYSEGFGTPPGTLGETGPFEFTIGPGISDWADAVAAGEQYVIFQLNNMEVTGITVVDASEPAEPIGADASNDAHSSPSAGGASSTGSPPSSRPRSWACGTPSSPQSPTARSRCTAPSRCSPTPRPTPRVCGSGSSSEAATPPTTAAYPSPTSSTNSRTSCSTDPGASACPRSWRPGRSGPTPCPASVTAPA